FFFIATSTTSLYTLSLHDALPILLTLVTGWAADRVDRRWIARASVVLELGCAASLAWFAWTNTTTLEILYVVAALLGVARAFARSEEHTSELQSQSNLVCRLLLEK